MASEASPPTKKSASLQLTSDLWNVYDQLQVFKNTDTLCFALREGFYYALADIELVDDCHDLFDVRKQIFDWMFDSVLQCHSQSVVLEKDVRWQLANTLEHYLKHFTKYRYMHKTLVDYMKELIHTTLDLYSKYILVLEIWFQQQVPDKRRLKFFILDIISNLYFIERDREQLENIMLIITLSKKCKVFYDWMVQNSLLDYSFMSNLLVRYNENLQAMESFTNPSITGPPTIDNFGYVELLLDFSDVLLKVDKNWGLQLFGSFELHVMNNVLSTTSVFNTQLILHTLNMLSYKKAFFYLSTLFTNNLLIQVLKEVTLEDLDLLFTLLDNILEENTPLVKAIFLLESSEQTESIDGPLNLYQLRIEGMRIIQDSHLSYGEITSRHYKIHAKYNSPNLGLHFNEKSYFSRLVLYLLMSYFTNPPELNEKLNSVIAKLIPTNLLRCQIYLEVISDSFQHYRFYKNMLSKIEKQRQSQNGDGNNYWRCLSRNAGLKEKLDPNREFRYSNSTLNTKTLIDNMELFTLLIAETFVSCKIYNINYNQREKEYLSGH